jgi:hypothetical protein
LSNADNPRAVVGDNQAPEYAKRVTEQMERDYAALQESITALLERARAAPTELTTDQDAVALGAIVKDLRDAYNRADAFRKAEKEPHLRGEQAVDSFFFTWMEKCRRRDPRDRSQKPGAADILQARIDAFLEAKRIAEAKKRQLEAEQAERVAREQREAADRLRRQEEETRAAADRARKPENVEALKTEAETVAPQVAAAAVQAEVATGQAEDKRIATLAKPADLSRTRGDGVLLTEARQYHAILLDRNKVDMNELRPYFSDAEIEKALRGYAKATNHSRPMDGADIGFRLKGQTR